MTEFALRIGRQARGLAGWRLPAHGRRLLVIAALFALMFGSRELRPLIFQAMSDAYLQVTVFVAATLALVYLFERALKFDLGLAMSNARMWQSPIASFLGALPGCGGAIIVVTQYTRGYVTFGSIVAVLIATMGDAAFLLIAREPMTGLMMMATGLVVGTISGWIIDAIHGPDFMRPAEPVAMDEVTSADAVGSAARSGAGPESGEMDLDKVLSRVWVAMVIPATVLGLMIAMRVPTDSLFGPLSKYSPTLWVGVIGAALCLIMWATAPRQNSHAGATVGSCRMSIGQRVIADTNFVTGWVVLGFLVYGIGVHVAGAGIETWLKVWAPFVPLAAIAVGFIPGCGPQIVVTTLYLAGAIPLSAQLGNAISNDGDALFPAIALAPRVAFWATIYSTVPALIIGYGYFFLFE